MRKVILLKKEAVYGTDAAPTAAANAVLTRNFTSKPIENDRIERNLDLPTRGRSKSAPSNRRTTFSFEVELAGSGAAGTAPAWMELLEACGMAAPAVTAGAKAEQKFAPEGVALSSLTGHHWVADERVRALGNRGSFSMDFTAGSYPFATLQMTGLLPPSPAVDKTPPAGQPDFGRWKEPLEVNTENTEFTLGDYSPVLKQFTLDANAEITIRNLVGANYVQRGNHAITGTIVIEATDLGAKNYYTSLDAGDEFPFTLTHGVAAGQIIELGGEHVEILSIDRSEEDDKLMLSISYGLNVSAGQDDLLITAK